jgi:hypothetical protein
VITKEKKSYNREHEIVWYLIDDVVKATNFLETTKKEKDLLLAKTLLDDDQS